MGWKWYKDFSTKKSLTPRTFYCSSYIRLTRYFLHLSRDNDHNKPVVQRNVQMRQELWYYSMLIQCRSYKNSQLNKLFALLETQKLKRKGVLYKYTSTVFIEVLIYTTRILRLPRSDMPFLRLNWINNHYNTNIDIRRKIFSKNCKLCYWMERGCNPRSSMIHPSPGIFLGHFQVVSLKLRSS